MPYVRTVPYREAEGELKATYDQLLEASGTIANVMAVNRHPASYPEDAIYPQLVCYEE